VIRVAGKKYARTDAQRVETLFEPDGTAAGFYKATPAGVLLYDHQRTLFAFVVRARGNAYFVTATGTPPRYMQGLATYTETALGIDGMTWTEQHQEAQRVIDQTHPQTTETRHNEQL